MNLLRKTRKAKKRITKKRLLLLIFSLIMTTFAWTAFYKILYPDFEFHIASWNIELHIDKDKDGIIDDDEPAEKKDENGQIKIELLELYPGMEEDVINVIIKNNGEVPSGIDYIIDNIILLGEEYTLVSDEAELANARVEGKKVLKKYEPTEDNGIVTYELINELDIIPFKIVVENTKDVKNESQGYLKVKVIWPLDKLESQTEETKNALDTKWGFEATKYVEEKKLSPIKFDITINAIGQTLPLEEQSEI